ncbi:hypothetical protein [Agrococcus casei]|uniref:Uncharacterized protein n=1 Tax=Agrococcus casei LMG 22410 TaxID=1255656 RepID=A0A1R4F8I4_9MICO|nr:hypothetical protein [Agrococcus casei]SJM52153.1 hypothetical protein CZ674_03040 [Agrococcus casei LMG 22410]
MRNALGIVGTLAFFAGAVPLATILFEGTWEQDSVRGTWLVVLTVGGLLIAWSRLLLPGGMARGRSSDGIDDRRRRRRRERRNSSSRSRPRRSVRSSRRSKPSRRTRSKPRRRR